MAFIFFLELLVLFLLSRTLTSEMSYLFYGIFRSRKVSIFLMAFIFLPGTLIHELSHAIMAKLLFVHVGRMELMPQLYGDSLKLGSVEVGKVDLFRNFLIGIAPFLSGTTLLLLILNYAFSNSVFGLNLVTGIVLYFLFVIANTMYSSRKDMEGAIEFFLLVLAPTLVLYFIGIRIPGLNWDIIQSGQIEEFFKLGSIYLGVPLIINLAIIVFAKIINKH